MLDSNQLKIDGLNRHLDFLQHLVETHIRWAGDTAELDKKDQHTELVKTFRHARTQYRTIIDTYSNSRH